MKTKQVSIPEALFVQITRYFLLNDHTVEDGIKRGLSQKYDAMHRRELYSRYKTDGDDKARLEYLRESGIPQNYIY